jgi:UDPglucose 6-dehydrogenase
VRRLPSAGVQVSNGNTLVIDLYRSVHDRPVLVTSIESAELLKVSYNLFISMKIVYANTLTELCEHTGADCDEVTSGA